VVEQPGGELDARGGARPKNWLHVGSVKSGPKVAAILSIIESCRRLGVPAKDYLLAVLPGLDHRMVSDVAQITPARWSRAHN